MDFNKVFLVNSEFCSANVLQDFLNLNDRDQIRGYIISHILMMLLKHDMSPERSKEITLMNLGMSTGYIARDETELQREVLNELRDRDLIEFILGQISEEERVRWD